MQNRTFVWPARCAIVLVASCFSAVASAQSPASGPPSNTNNDWMAQASKLYYSSSKAGLKGFDCAVRPGWQTLFTLQDSGQVSVADQTKVNLLNQVGIAIHARMDGGSIMDWNPPAQQLDTDQTKLLDDMHSAMNQTVQGFMQFWTPFVENQVVPDTAEGLDVVTTDDGGRKIHLKSPEIELSETFDSGRVLRQYNVIMSGAKVDVTPTYSPSEHGLLISHFHAFIRPADDAGKQQEMNVEVTYQWLEGYPIPAHLDLNVIGVADLTMAFEGCTVQR
jgi:hypothetical protein